MTITSRERLQKKVSISDSGCWIWIGARGIAGYGNAYYEGKMVAAHRAMWMLFFGQLAEGLVVAHSCDNKLCVNPEHLFATTQKENMADASRKGRTTQGEKNHSAKLNAEDVRAIRDAYETGAKQWELAKLYGVSQGQVSGIVRGKMWAHIR